MEGIYSGKNVLHISNAIENIFAKKSGRLICSFSDENALRKPLMWGYYCYGLKGVVLEVEVPEDRVKPVNYYDREKFFEFDKDVEPNFDALVDDILTRKLSCWDHENEFRFLTHHNEKRQSIGEITSVIIGHPYPKTPQNPNKDGRQEAFNAYRRRKAEVRDAANRNGINIKNAMFRNGKITIKS